VTSTGIERWLPGLRLLRTYHKSWLRNDLAAGLSLAAVAMPIGIAYAQLAGFPPVVGIYSSIFPPVAYALFYPHLGERIASSQHALPIPEWRLDLVHVYAAAMGIRWPLYPS
jgi:hypothetical protein